MTAGRVLAVQGAGLLVAGFGAAAVLLLRDQRRVATRVARMAGQLLDLEGLATEQGKTLIGMLRIANDELDDRRKALQRR